MQVKYGFFEQLKDFFRLGPKAYLASTFIAVLMVVMLIAVYTVPEFGVSLLIAGLLVGVIWAYCYILNNWP